MILRLLTSALVLSLTSRLLVSSSRVRTTNSIGDSRLPTNIIPIHYDIQLKTYLPGYSWQADDRNLTFEGSVVVTSNVVETTDRIVLHADSLEISHISVTDPTVNVTNWEITQESQFLTIYLSDQIQPQEGFAFLIEFKGKLRNDLQGFFLTPSTKLDGSKVINAVTHFEPSKVRFMIPCFDEPAFKATWKMKLEYPSGAVALSNGIEESTETVSKEWTVTNYKMTVKMSSYLLAVFIGDVEYRETTTNNGVRIRVYVDPTKVGNIDHALEIARSTVETFEEHLGVKFPMEKIDFVGVEHFHAGAMENWGLIIHRNSLLVGNNLTVTETIIHELAHQWFGNLVTMKWWDQVWLNEGFASFMVPEALSYLNSSYDKDFSITVDNQRRGFVIDKKYPLNDFDRNYAGIPLINYKKGSSFIRMIQKIVGEDNFSQALQYYLRENQYQNVDESDLYNAVASFSPEQPGPNGKMFNLEEFAYCWTRQNGYPTVYVEKVGEGRVSITQKMEVKIENGYEKYGVCGYKWDLPIWYQSAGSDDMQLAWLGKDDNQLELDTDLPVLINANSYGFYRVIYSDELYKSFGDIHSMEQYSYSSKFRLISDATIAVWKSDSDPGSFLNLIDLAMNEQHAYFLSTGRILLAKTVFQESRRPNPDSQVLERLEVLAKNHILQEPLFGECSLNDTFDACRSKSNFNQICERTLTTEHYEENVKRLFGWLNNRTQSLLKPIIECAVPEYLMSTFETTLEETPIEKGKPTWRLPTNAIPIRYDLTLKTYLPGYGWEADERNMTFEGRVLITVRVVEATDRIVLHSDSLSIERVGIDVELFNVNVTRWELTPEHHFLVVYLSDTLQAHTQINFEVKYNGRLREDGKGFYRTRSFKNGETIMNAVTQFETTDARKMVPCFDEPSFKAQWDVSLHHPVGSVALANGIEIFNATSDNFTITVFDGTVKMSSYLLAVFIGDVQYKQIITDSGVRIRVYTDPSNINQVDFALKTSRSTVEGFEKQFGINYPMKKIDFVSAYDFKFGAMENWGLIVHAMRTLIGENDAVLTTVIHELAHQWFGNLVTLSFWEYMWLNEGFANYMTHRAIPYWFPNYDRELGLVIFDQSEAFDDDSSANQLEIRGALVDYTRSEDGNIEYSGPVYSKGASFIRMIEHIMGTANFDLAIRYYLGVHQYQNVEQSDLFDAFNKFLPPGALGSNGVQLDIHEFARCWTDQNGYPTVHVEIRDDHTNVLTQTYDGLRNESIEYACGHKWDIPIWYQSVGSETIQLTWMGRDDVELEIEADGPLIINANSNGFYLVKYSDTIISLMSSNFSQEGYTDSTKFRLMDDFFRFRDSIDLQAVLPIVKTFLNSEVETISYLAKKLIFFVNEQNKTLPFEMRTELQSLIEKYVGDERLLANCSSDDTFKECLPKMDSMTLSRANLLIRNDPEEEKLIKRLLNWLEEGKEEKETEEICLFLLKFAHIEKLKKVLNDYPELRSLVMDSIENKKSKNSYQRKSPTYSNNFTYNFNPLSDF